MKPKNKKVGGTWETRLEEAIRTSEDIGDFLERLEERGLLVRHEACCQLVLAWKDCNCDAHGGADDGRSVSPRWSQTMRYEFTYEERSGSIDVRHVLEDDEL
jgi:hypothetical protein